MKFKSNTGPRKAWTKEQCEAVLSLYMQFLAWQKSETPYQKAAPVRGCAALIGKTKGAVEAKMMNISGVLDSLDKEYVTGYKPLKNAQKLLVEVVKQRVGA